MGFSFPFFKKQSASKSYFGLYITDSRIFGMVFNVGKTAPQILAQNTFSLSSGFDKILEDVDNLISELEISSQTHLEKTIFFLHSWMIDQESYEIKAPYKDIIKKLAKELELEPLGYIEVRESLGDYFAKIGVTDTIALEVNKTKLGLMIFAGSKNVKSQYIARTDDVGEDISILLKDLAQGSPLPKVIRIYGDEDKAEVASYLATFEWNNALFPEHPTIEIIKQDELNQTLIQSFSREILNSGQDVGTPVTEASHAVVPAVVVPDSTSSVFGFIEGDDIAKKENVVQPTLTEPSHSPPQPPELLRSPVPIETPIQTPLASRETKSFLSKFFRLFKRKDQGLEKNETNMKKYLIIGAVVLTLVILIGAYEFFLNTLHINIVLQSKAMEDSFNIDLPIKDADTEGLAAIQKTIVKDYSNKKSTTGSRDIGEKATGTVVIHNFDNSERTFQKGTEISKGSLVFLLDSEVKVASSSGVISSDGKKQSGSKSVRVTAKEIGSEYNLKSGTQFKIASLSDSLFVGISESDFSGGTKKEVTTVSKNDQDVLETQAETQAEKDAKNILGESITEDEIVIPDLTNVKIEQSKFSGEIGEEAKEVSIQAKSTIDYYTVQKELLLKEIQNEFIDKVEELYTVDAETIDFSIEKVKKGKNALDISVDATAKTHKEISLDEVKKIATFRTLRNLEGDLKKSYEIESVSFERPFSWVPVLSLWSPAFQKNITITTTVE